LVKFPKTISLGQGKTAEVTMKVMVLKPRENQSCVGYAYYVGLVPLDQTGFLARYTEVRQDLDARVQKANTAIGATGAAATGEKVSE
jgi:hypothetical protein